MALLAVTGLFIGVMNDAANFLNSAIGSKASPVRVIMAVASVGIIVGAVTVLVWKQFALWGLYEIVPGFILGWVSVVVASLLSAEPSKSMRQAHATVEREFAQISQGRLVSTT